MLDGVLQNVLEKNCVDDMTTNFSKNDVIDSGVEAEEENFRGSRIWKR